MVPENLLDYSLRNNCSVCHLDSSMFSILHCRYLLFNLLRLHYLFILQTLANYLQNVRDRDRIASELEQKLISGTGNVDAGNTTLLIVAATIFCHETNYEAALRVLHSAPSDHLECTALRLDYWFLLLQWVALNGITVNGIIWLME